MKVRKLLRKLALSASVFVALLVAGELAARWAEPGPMSLFDHSPYRDDPQLDYVHRPGFVGRWDSTWYDINSKGWRGPEVEPTFAPDELRIVALGDSATFGKGVVEADTWPRQLETMLRERLGDTRHPVIFNLGVNGYSLWQYERVLEAAADELKPQLVIVGYNVNDYDSAANQADKMVFSAPARRKASKAGNGGGARPGSKPDGGATGPGGAQQQEQGATQAPPAKDPGGGGADGQSGGQESHAGLWPLALSANANASASLAAQRTVSSRPEEVDPGAPTLRSRLRALIPRGLRDSLNRFALYRFLRATYYENSRERDYQRIADIVRELATQDPAQRERELEHEGGFLGQLVEVAHRSNARVVLFLFPFEAMIVVDDFSREPEDFVAELARRQGVDYVDVPDAFRDYLGEHGKDVRLFIRGDRYHPNAEGYRVVARTLADYLEREHLLEPRD